MAIKSPQGSIVDTPRGTTDYGTRDAIAINEICSVVEEVFRRFGFSPIITPSIETTAVLSAKAYGDESTKEMLVLEGNDTALRFDFTVPLARFMAMNKDLPFPFKRYQIGTVWRNDEPQFMRSREIMQADIDIVGSAELSSEVECIAAMLFSLEALNLEKYALLMSSRPLLNLILGHFSVPKEKQDAAIRAIDKMQKAGVSETIKQLIALGVEGNNAQSMISFITESSDNGAKLNRVEMNVEGSKAEVDRLRSILSMLQKYGLKGDITIDLSLARGLDYYTGPVWEVIVESENGARLPSIASGGRYDRLVGMYSKSETPAVGSSIGITRLFSIIKGKGERRTFAKAYILQIGKDVADYSIETALKLRGSGVYVDLNVTEKGISKQLDYANSVGVKYVIIIGRQELESKKLKLKDMQSGTEELLDLVDVIDRLKK